MSDVCMAAEMIREVEPRRHRSVKEWISATARRLGWRYGRAKAVWYQEARRIDATEMAALRNALRSRKLQEGRHEYEEISERIARLETLLRARDEDFHGVEIDALRQIVGRVDRPGDHED